MSNYDKTVKISFEGVDNVSPVFNKIKQTIGGAAGSVASWFGFGGANMGAPTGPAAAKEKIHDRKTKRKQKEATKQRKEQVKSDKEHMRFLQEELRAEKKITQEKEKQKRIDGRSGGGGSGWSNRPGKRVDRYVKDKIKQSPEFLVTGGAKVVTAVLSRIVGFMKSQITSGYSSYLNYGRARAGLAGMGNPSNRLLHAGQNSGYSMVETIQQMQGMGRATGVLSPITKAQQMARSYGGSVGEVTGFFGTLTRAGQGFGGQAGTGGKRQVRRILSDAFKSGLDKSRAGEVLQSVAQGVRSAQGSTAGAVDASKISGLLSFFSRSGKSGLQGARGAQVMGALDSTIKGAGRLSASPEVIKTLLLQSQGFGVPGGNTDYLTATSNLEQGIFGKGGAKNLVKMVNRVNQLPGNSRMHAAQLSALTGGKLNQSVSGSILGVMAKGGSTGDVLKSIEAITKEERPINEKLLDNSSENLRVARRVAKLDNRLVEIGKKSAKDIEKMQDAMLSVADTLMPTALVVLRSVATGVQTIAEGINSMLHAIPGAQDDLARSKAVSAERSRQAFATKYAHGTGMLSSGSRGAFLAEATTARNNQQVVMQADRPGVLPLTGQQRELAKLNLNLYNNERNLASSSAEVTGVPTANIGARAMRDTYGRYLRTKNRHGNMDWQSNVTRQFEEASFRDQYSETHNGATIPQEVLTNAMLDLALNLQESSNRNNTILDMSTYRSMVAPAVDTTVPEGQVE